MQSAIEVLTDFLLIIQLCTLCAHGEMCFDLVIFCDECVDVVNEKSASMH